MKNIYIEQCESTMNEAKKQWNLNDNSNGYIIYTHNQTNGRGRGTHLWTSKTQDILFTFLCKVETEEDLRKTGVISLLTMSKILKETYGIEMKGKWPNDGYIENKKLVGILVEVDWNNGMFYVNIGIGLNVEKKSLETSISLSELINEKDIDEIQLFEAFRKTFFEYLQLDVHSILKMFNEIDFLKGKTVRLCNTHYEDDLSEHIEGIIIGYSEDWKVLLDVDGDICEFDREDILLPPFLN